MAYLHVCMKQHVEDDWNLFEQAALLRERELESEDEGSENWKYGKPSNLLISLEILLF